jgi:ferredoxin-NADP reductase
MLTSLADLGRQQDVYLFYGVRNSGDHVFREPLQTLRAEHSQWQVCVCYSRPSPQDQLGRDYDVAGRITIDLLRNRLPSSNYQFYLCGPPPFVTDLSAGLRAWRVPDTAIHAESFVPPTTMVSLHDRANSHAAPVPVEFSQSGVQAMWHSSDTTLLELAESRGITIDSGCRAGHCGTCATAIRKGRVRYLAEPACPVAPGTCLPCLAQPDGPVVLDV